MYVPDPVPYLYQRKTTRKYPESIIQRIRIGIIRGSHNKPRRGCRAASPFPFSFAQGKSYQVVHYSYICGCYGKSHIIAIRYCTIARGNMDRSLAGFPRPDHIRSEIGVYSFGRRDLFRVNLHKRTDYQDTPEFLQIFCVHKANHFFNYKICFP